MHHSNVQDLGKSPLTTMLRPAHHQRRKTEGAGRPSLPPRSRSNPSAPNYSRPQERDGVSVDVRTPRLFVDRRHSGGNTRGDGFDTLIPKAWVAKGSKLLKRQNSKHELTSLRTLDWKDQNEEVRAHHLRPAPPPPDLKHSRMRSTGDRKFIQTVDLVE